MVVLSKRLQALADMVSPGNRVADVGCDHGFVSIYLVQNRISPYVYAMDVREGPLQRAKEHIASYGMENYIETRLSDGVQALLPGEADALVLAGMGGKLMQKILTEGAKKVSLMKELILQPQSEISAFRAFLRQENYDIIDEKMILEDGKYYPMMKVVPKAGSKSGEELTKKQVKDSDLQRLEDKFGRLLLERKDSVLIQYLHFDLKIHEEILSKLQQGGGNDQKAQAARQKRAEEVLTEIEDMKRALSGMEAGNDNDYSECKRNERTVPCRGNL